MATIIRVSIEIETVVIADDNEGLGLVEQIQSGLSTGACDPDLVLWLLEGATVRARVSF